MELNFQITPSIYHQALAVHRSYGVHKKYTVRYISFFIIFIACLIVLFLILFSPRHKIQTYLIENLTNLISWLVVLAIAMFSTDWIYRHPSAKFSRYKLLIVAVLVAAIILLFLRIATSSVLADPATRSFSHDVLLPLLPWILIYLSLFLFMAISNWFIHRYATRRLWAGQPMLQRSLKVTINDDAWLTSGSDFSSQFAWTGFIRCIESADLFLIYVSQFNFFLIPKSAFETSDQLATFAALCNKRIPNYIHLH